MRKIVKKTYPNGGVKFIIQYKFLWWWSTEQTFSESWHGEGGYTDLEFDSFDEAKQYISPIKYETCK